MRTVHEATLTNSEWMYLTELAPRLRSMSRARLDIDYVLQREGSKGDRVRIRNKIYNRLNPEYTGTGYPGEKRVQARTIDVFFEIAWKRAVEETPELADDRSSDWNVDRNRQILWTAWYSHDAEDVRSYYQSEWERRLGRPLDTRDQAVYEGWYDESESLEYTEE